MWQPQASLCLRNSCCNTLPSTSALTREKTLSWMGSYWLEDAHWWACHMTKTFMSRFIVNKSVKVWLNSGTEQGNYSYTGWPEKNGTDDTVDFSGLCSDQQLSFFTLLDRTSFPHYNNTKIIKFGWELFISWVISYGLSFSRFARFPEFRGTINDKWMANPDKWQSLRNYS